ncbi:MAG TPA: bifunctional diguanylate cyclase/phosphodiesterase [Chloroflexia bacterium]|nr:bifunctional diguanylate cyclase/phosphodiesterase [Chloroflexia bacterium]
MSKRAWFFIYSVYFAALVAATLLIIDLGEAASQPLIPAVLLIGMAIVAQLYGVETLGRSSYYPHFVFFFAGVFLLHSFYFVLIIAIPHLTEWVLKRFTKSKELQAWYLQPFNISTHLLAGFACVETYKFISTSTFLFDLPWKLPSIMLLGLVYVFINHSLIGFALMVARNVPLKDSGVFNPDCFLPDLYMACTGYLIVLLYSLDPWYVLLILIPLALMYRAFKIPQLQQEAQMDAKTGLFNARYFNKIFEEEFKRAQQFKQPIAFLMADLDLMRNINNTYGHLAGDAVLTGVGSAIRQSIPDQATAGRFGGEEFAVILPGVSQAEAQEVGERIRSTVEASLFEVSTCPTPIRATMSIGVACFPQDAYNLTDLTHAADIAVYHAKHSGRNLVVSASSVPQWVIAEEAAAKQVVPLLPGTGQNPAVNNMAKNPEQFLVDGGAAQERDKLTEKALDTLTRLPNRVAWLESLNLALARQKGQRSPMAVLLFDLDRFQFINDSLGQAIGDRLLTAFASRVSSYIRVQDLFARVGDDEFALLLETVNDENEPVSVAHRINEALKEPFVWGKQTLYVTCCTGIVITSQAYYSSTNVMRDANIALHQAKNKGKGRYQVFEPGMNEHVRSQFELEGELRRALKENQFELYYQPKIELATGSITGMEALIRWNHPQKGLISPAHFIPVAEDTGLICQIGEWVLEEACKQIKLWNSLWENEPPLIVSVNLSPVQFSQPDLARKVEEILRKTEVSPGWLQLEVTERVIMEEVKSNAFILKKLKGLGVQLAIDDFGTGYSSMNYLKQFPFDTLKIDRTFIADFDHSQESRAIVQAILHLGNALKMRVIAEGVETAEELLQLNDLGCELAQGYFFARPMSANALTGELNTSFPRLTGNKRPTEHVLLNQPR